jgi:hypothetical protein
MRQKRRNGRNHQKAGENVMWMLGGMSIRVGADIGIIIRDHLGKPISSTWKTCTDYASAEEADLMVVFVGLGSWR